MGDVWSSSDGASWTDVIGRAAASRDGSREPSPPITGNREGHVLIAHAGRLWLVGGKGSGGYYVRDVWTFDGKERKEDTQSVPFPPRMNAASVSFDQRMWILGGSERGVRNDVWWSK